MPWPGPAPSQEPSDTATSNENPVLPHTAAAGAARAAAVFERMFTIAQDATSADASADDKDFALQRILAIAEAAIGDVGRFAPAAMRQAASDQVAQMVAEQAPPQG